MAAQVNDHITAGMKTIYEVTEGPGSAAALARINSSPLKGVTRDYYVAAEKVLWDYAPLGGDACSGSLQPFTEAGAIRAANNVTAGQAGSRRYRAMYVEYTDASFTVKKVDCLRFLCACFCADMASRQARGKFSVGGNCALWHVHAIYRWIDCKHGHAARTLHAHAW